MRPGIIFRYVGLILLVDSAFMLISMIIALADPADNTALFPFLLSFFITATVGVFPLIFIPTDNYISIKEVYGVVVISWLAICLFGTLPYFLWGGEFSLINSWFESVSGYTTTGATILNDVEILPKSILFYRSSSHWMGGVGVVLFALLIAPAMRMNKTKLSKLEMSALAQDNFLYKTHETIKIILTVYITITALCIIMLRLAGMDWFGAINHSFSTIATGGFSTKNISIAAYNNPWIYIIISLFMFLSTINFGLLFAAVTGRSTILFRSPLVKYYIIATFIGITAVTLNLWFSNVYSTLGESLLHSTFQVISFSTTTGYASSNSIHWSSFSILILIFFMIQGGCAGSTAGGLKVDRILIFFKSITAQIKKQQHPNAIITVKVGNTNIEDDVSFSVVLYMMFFMFIVFLGTIILSLMNIDLLSAFSASLASLTNTGQGFSLFSSLNNYSVLHPMGKILLTFMMIAGRLEIYGLLLLFFLKSWR